MSESTPHSDLPDLKAGIPAAALGDREPLLGQVDGEPVLLVRRGDAIHAVGATCTHYGANLADGILVDETVRCPLHHACFDLETGEATRAPALAPLPRFGVERRQDRLFVTGRLQSRVLGKAAPLTGLRARPDRVVILGAGAAGTAAALTLRQEGYDGQVTLIGEESEAPYDRPNLSKDYLAGTAGEEWLPLCPRETYQSLDIRVCLGTRAARLELEARTVWVADGQAFPYDALLIATGASPLRPPIPGLDRPHVHMLRSVADCRALVAGAERARSVVVIGAGFIGLEAAAALRTRGLTVHVVAPGRRPLEQVLGAELGVALQRLHETRGVAFHMGHNAVEIDQHAVRLDDGSAIDAELVLVATGVAPNTALAGRAGLILNRGIQVDRYLETSVRGVFAAGDVARWPDARSGVPVRFEHWATAERQGQTVARNMLGALEPFEAVPFFWTQHYDVRVNYVGHASSWDRLQVQSGLPEGQWEQRYFVGDTLVAVATIGRDRASLDAELALESAVATDVPARSALRPSRFIVPETR
ncbi:MAG TPA: FAD-dependent oxidoreductase [Gemmatimonadales bacterium]|nr:FAD-dependent oxidoreductase [Gemmatimonadales bacterium]